MANALRDTDGRLLTRDDIPELHMAALDYEHRADQAAIIADSDHEVEWAEDKNMVEARDEIAKAERRLAQGLDAYARAARNLIRRIEEVAR